MNSGTFLRSGIEGVHRGLRTGTRLYLLTTLVEMVWGKACVFLILSLSLRNNLHICQLCSVWGACRDTAQWYLYMFIKFMLTSYAENDASSSWKKSFLRITGHSEKQMRTGVRRMYFFLVKDRLEIFTTANSFKDTFIWAAVCNAHRKPALPFFTHNPHHSLESRKALGSHSWHCNGVWLYHSVNSF